MHLILFCSKYLCISLICLTVPSYCHRNYSNEWLMKADLSSEEAEYFSIRNGFHLYLKLTDDLFILTRNDIPRSSSQKMMFKLKNIGYSNRIHLMEQQKWEDISLKQFTVEDPLWNQMWYINRISNVTMNVFEAWNSNYTGRGVNVAIVDNGVEHRHMDLKDRYNAVNSIDVYDHDDDPSPNPGFTHGTNCAGIAVATKNTVCVVGIAYHSLLVAIRMIGPLGVTDAGKASALANTGAHISSNSWGGIEHTFDGPSKNVADALKHGATKLRGQKGVIYVFSAGNGGFDDNCNADGYVNNIYTIGINAVSRDFKPPGYAEPCTAVLASTFSGPGGTNADNLCSTDENDSCTTTFTGTSAATAVAAGILALVLEANPDLSWRDVQELIVITSKTDGLLNGNFRRNGIGRQVSDVFGFGLLDTMALIKAAKNWTCLPPQHTCSSGVITVNGQIQAHDPTRHLESEIIINGCNNSVNCVSQIEHVQVAITFDYSLRGAVMLYLDSPMGTRSELLSRRNLDRVRDSRQVWTFMSVQHWGEDPLGIWKLTMSLQYDWSEHGTLVEWSLIIYGTGVECSSFVSTTATCGSVTQETEKNVKVADNEDDTLDLPILIGGLAGGIAVACIAVPLVFFLRNKCLKQGQKTNAKA